MAGSHSSTHTEGQKLAGMPIQSSSRGQCITMGWGRGRLSCNLIDYMAFTAIPHTTSDTTQTGGKGGGSSQTTSETTYTYSASIMMALCEGSIGGIVSVYKDTATFTGATCLADAGGLSLAVGSSSQTPWPYLTSLFPTHALAYRTLAYVYAQDYDLGSSGSLPNHGFEVDFAIQLGGGVHDANPKDIIADFLTNPSTGVTGWASGLLGDHSDYSLYCRANNLLLSPVLEDQLQASDFIRQIMDMTHSDCFFSEGLLKIRPFGDAAATGNGVTWTPNLTPVFDLDEDDFLGEVTLQIVDQTDAYNQVQCEFLDRTNEYNPEIAPAQDLDNILTYGARKQDPQQWHFIADPAIARDAIQLWLQRVLYVRDLLSFDLPEDFIALEPMDIVSLTTTVDGMKLNHQLARIVSIDEDEEGSEALHVVAEALPFTASKASYGGNSGGGYRPGVGDDPGNVQTPQLFNAPLALTKDNQPEAWAAVCGVNAAWGGCFVWASLDGGTNYSRVGKINAPARFGTVYSATFPSAADPDTTNTLNVDLTLSKGQLDSFSHAQADSGVSLCMVDNELIAFSTATLSSANKYALSGYIRRGQRGSVIAAHSVGARFIRLDNAIFRFAYPDDNSGGTVYLKFQSFNLYGRMVQDLAGLTAYSLVLTPQGSLPGAITGLALAGSGGMTWTGANLNIVCDPADRATTYSFQIYKSDGVTLLRTIVSATPQATYSNDLARVDGAQRTYKIKAFASNATGNGATSGFITVTDTAPAAVTSPTATGGAFDATVACSASSSPDLAGYAVFYSSTSGFDPYSQGNVVRAATPSLAISGLPAGTYYCKIAAYDGWTSDPRQLNLSTQMSFTITTGGGSTPTGSGGGGSGGGGTGGSGYSGKEAV